MGGLGLRLMSLTEARASFLETTPPCEALTTNTKLFLFLSGKEQYGNLFILVM